MNQVEVKRRQIQSWSWILGLVIILLFGRMLGDNGIAYLAAAYECFAFLWIILGSGIADAMGKMLRGRSVKGQYKNVQRVRKYFMLIQCIMGLAGSLVFVFGGYFVISYIFSMPRGVFAAVLLAPAFFLRMVSAVLLGYFQGEGSELPTAVSGVIRQALILGFGWLFCILMQGYGEKVSALKGVEDFTAMYGAAGLTLGITVAELFTFLFLIIVYRGSSRKVKNYMPEGLRTTDSFGSLAGILYGTRLQMMSSRLLMRLPVWLGIVFLQKSTADTFSNVIVYGRYYGKYLILCAILILLTDALLVSSSVKVYNFLRKEELKYARICFQGGLHLAVVQGLFFSVFLTAMGSQLAGILCESGGEDAAVMLSYGAFTVFFVTAADYFFRLLMLGGRWHLALMGLGGMNIVFAVFAAAFLNGGHLGVQSLVYAGLIAAAVLCPILGFFVCRQFKVNLDWLQIFAVPAGCACVTGLVCLFLGKVLTPNLGNPVTALVCLVLSVLLYWGLLLILRNFREQELKMIPGGALIRSMGQMLRTYR